MVYINDIIKDFPALNEKTHGKRFVYLDNAATTLKPTKVINAVFNYYTTNGTNTHRSVYEMGVKATDLYEGSRRKVADFFGVKNEKEIIFTKGATESINAVAYAWGRANINEGDEILLSEAEHHANLIPWQIVAKEKNASLNFIPVNEKTGEIILENIDSLITDKTKIVCVSGMSNVTGIITDLEKIIETAHKKSALVLVDAAQLVPHHKINLSSLDCDFMACSAHKFLGPTGVGVLYAKYSILEEMPPFLFGGSMIVKVKKDSATYMPPPEKFEGGTQNIAGVIGMGAAIDYINEIGLDTIAMHEKALLRYAREKASSCEDITVYGGDIEKSGGILSFNIGDTHPHDVGQILDSNGVAIRVGHHCCQVLMKALKIGGTSRASFYLYNTKEDIDILFEALNKVREVFNGA